MIDKVKLMLIALCLAVGLVALFYVQQVRIVKGELKASQRVAEQAQTDLKQALVLREKEQIIASRYAATITALKSKQRTQDAKLEAAIAANAPWSDQRVPSDVVDAIGL